MSGVWISAEPRSASRELPPQGWKLHISAYRSNFAEVVERAVPILVANETSFKVVRDFEELDRLNAGLHGAQQAGKAITVYPRTDAEAVHIAGSLAAVTVGMVGPPVRTDRAILGSKTIWYRYGAFVSAWSAGTDSRLQLRSPDDERIVDERRFDGVQPTWVDDPFEVAGLAAPDTKPNPMVGQRWLLVHPLTRAAKGTVHLGIDVDSGRRCVVRETHRDAGLAPGRGWWQLEAECRALEALEALGGGTRVPRLLGTHVDGDRMYAAVEHIDGETLAKWRGSFVVDGTFPAGHEMIRVARDVLTAYAGIHELGWIHGDVKNTNIVVDGVGEHVTLIDFETAQRPADGAVLSGGSRGYTSPERHGRGAPASFADDVYGIGAVLATIVTGREPILNPSHEASGLDMALFHPQAPTPLIAAAQAALAHDAGARPTVGELLTIIDSVHATEPTDVESAPQDPVSVAEALVQSLQSRAEPVGGGVGWRSTSDDADGRFVHDLYRGSSGLVLALSDAAQVEIEGACDLIEAALGPLRSAVDDNPDPGLFTGAIGGALAVAASGDVLGSADCARWARDTACRAAASNPASFDFIEGDAGVIVGLIELSRLCGEADFLEFATQRCERLLAKSDIDGSGRYWSAAGRPDAGLAHGTAGAVGALLAVAESAVTTRYDSDIRAALDWIVSRAEPCGPDSTGSRWRAKGLTPALGSWCYGAAGIAPLLGRAARYFDEPRYRDVARRAVVYLTNLRAINTSLCHGLLGSIMAGDATGDELGDATMHQASLPLQRIVHASMMRNDLGYLEMFGDNPLTTTPDLMIGFGGLLPYAVRGCAPRAPLPMSYRILTALPSSLH